MTLDERMNQLEDEIRRLKDTINHNNKVARAIKEKQDARIEELEKKLSNTSQPNYNFNDIFGGGVNKP